jgi:protein SCO1
LLLRERSGVHARAAASDLAAAHQRLEHAVEVTVALGQLLTGHGTRDCLAEQEQVQLDLLALGKCASKAQRVVEALTAGQDIGQPVGMEEQRPDVEPVGRRARDEGDGHDWYRSRGIAIGLPYSLPVLRLMAFTVAVLACIALAACGSSQPQTRTTHSLSNLAGKLEAPAQLRTATPQFALKDSTGKLVRLSQFRGKAVLLTFIYDHCPDACPLIVANLHTALLKLGPAASKLQIIAVSVDPRGDTPATVKAFLAAHEMTGRMAYLIGSSRELAPVWRAYGVQVQGSPEKREDVVGHSAFVYGITGSGSVLVIYPPTFEPSWIVHDAPLLATY